MATEDACQQHASVASRLVTDTEQTTRATGRCESHPRRPAEYACRSCGKPLCLTCAIPVRGVVLGAECVGSVAGPGARDEPEPSAAMDHHPAFLLTGLAFLVAAAGTVLPWSAPSYSHFTGLFGGWGFSPLAWSLVAALSAASGLALWMGLALRRARGSLLAALPVLAGVGSAGTALYILWPPFATHPWLGPWISLVALALAIAPSVWAVRQRERVSATAS